MQGKKRDECCAQQKNVQSVPGLLARIVGLSVYQSINQLLTSMFGLRSRPNSKSTAQCVACASGEFPILRATVEEK